ncbi:MAG: T9SS type A sorting domain-containing protein [Paludibacteraceae bacterium]|nr:T9SS type A sorting domain-containing protein [Paludibacteraceae bacterium]
MKKSILLSMSLLAMSVFAKVSDMVLPQGMEILTPAGVTVTVEDSRSVDKAKNMVVAGDKTNGYKVFFTASENAHGEELWVSDGTVAGTKMVKDIFPGETSSGVAWMQRFNNKVVFQAQSDVDTGTELWISDGTEAGTYMVMDIHIFGSSNPSGFTQINENQFIFAAKDFESETYNENVQRWLWISDGTEAGTQLLKDCEVLHPGSHAASDNALHFARVGRKVFFKADTKDQEFGQELWVTDGTEAGTFMLMDINTSVVNELTGATAGSQIDWLTNFYNEKVFFQAYSIDHGTEPWVSDGTPEGTYMIKDMWPGVNASNLPNGSGVFTARVYNGKVYFRGHDETVGEELCVSDLTEAGTQTVFDINKNPTTAGTNNGFPDLFCEFDGVLFMKGQTGGDATSTDPVNYGLELFYTDGTAEGTKMQSDLNPGVGHNAAWEGTVISGSMYFRAQNAVPAGSQSWELFRIDSKDEFPVKVMDLVEGQDFVHSLRNMAGDVVFTSKAVPSLFRYNYRKPGFDPVKDVESMEPEYRTRDEQTSIQLPHSAAKDMKLYPNPASNYFSFDAPENVENIRIIDITGKEILRIASPMTNKVDISRLQKGVYTVYANSGKSVYRNLLIVK